AATPWPPVVSPRFGAAIPRFRAAASSATTSSLPGRVPGLGTAPISQASRAPPTPPAPPTLPAVLLPRHHPAYPPRPLAPLPRAPNPARRPPTPPAPSLPRPPPRLPCPRPAYPARPAPAPARKVTAGKLARRVRPSASVHVTVWVRSSSMTWRWGSSVARLSH